MTTEPFANPNALRELYRLATLSGLDADTLARWAAGSLAPAERATVAARLDADPQARALANVLVDLAPDSRQLAAAVQALGTAHHAASRQAPRHVAHAADRRHLRRVEWLGVVAVLALAFGLWGWQHHVVTVDGHAVATQTGGDTIFDSGMDRHGAVVRDDEIFRPVLRSDDIFRSAFNRNG